MAKSKKAGQPGRVYLKVLGTSGLKQYGGVIDEEFLTKLKGERAVKVYREMADNSSTIGAVLFITEALVRQVEWRVEEAQHEDTEAAAEWAAFLEGCLDDMSTTWEDLISEVLSFLVYGWSYFEVLYKVRRGQTNDPTTRSAYNDGRIGWRKFALRAQDTLERWEFDEEDDGLRGMWQTNETKGGTFFIPIEKALLFRTKVTKNNPEGRSILRNAYVDYYYLKRISNIEAVGIERDLTGLPVFEVPLDILSQDATPEAKALRAQFEDLLKRIKADEQGVALVPPEVDSEGKPTGYKFKLMSTAGARAFDTDKTKQYYKISILQSVVAQFIQLGMAGVGSFALASSQTNLFATALGQYLSIICSTFNRYAVAKLMQLNNVPRELWPSLVYGDVETPNLGEIGAYIVALAQTGKLPEDDALDRRLLEIGGLPVPEAGEGEVQKSRRAGPLRMPSGTPARGDR